MCTVGVLDQELSYFPLPLLVYLVLSSPFIITFKMKPRNVCLQPRCFSVLPRTLRLSDGNATIATGAELSGFVSDKVGQALLAERARSAAALAKTSIQGAEQMPVDRWNRYLVFEGEYTGWSGV